MDPSLPSFKDEAGERLLETGKKVVGNIARGAARSVKGQITGKQVGDVNQVGRVDQGNIRDKTDRKVDPVTGKPTPSKKVLTQLSQQVAQLAQMRMKKVREELEKQRLKVKQVEQEKQVEQVKEKEDVIARVLKASKSTGEFGKNIGG